MIPDSTTINQSLLCAIRLKVLLYCIPGKVFKLMQSPLFLAKKLFLAIAVLNYGPLESQAITKKTQTPALAQSKTNFVIIT